MNSTDDSAFARLGNRELVDGIRRQLDELSAARDQIERLLELVVGLTSDLELDATLDRIIDAAMVLTGAEYGALAVRGDDGSLVSFIHHGMPAETVAAIGELPAGKGLLGFPLEGVGALRLAELTAHPASAGFPEHHPPMHAFLGVAITIRGSGFGSLYLTHAAPGREFSDADEMSARVLASAAAAAIDNARLFERVRTTAGWIQASREISTALLSDTDPPESPMGVIAQRACELTRAEQAIVLVPVAAEPTGAPPTSLVVTTAVGPNSDDVLGQRIPISGTTSGEVFATAHPVITQSFRHPIPAFTDVGQRPAIAMPLCTDDSVIGVMVVARRHDDAPFDDTQLGLLGDFLGHATIAMTLAAARRREAELTLVADRERIAHDMHDHVIQRLFAAGLDLQGSIARSPSAEVNARLARTIDDLQATIETIRSTIFHLQAPVAGGDGFRERLERVVTSLTQDRGLATGMHFTGPLGSVGTVVADNAEAVTAEAVSNAVRHANASHVDVAVTVDDVFTLEVSDDGSGIPAGNHRASGLANMQRRAEVLGGTCAIGAAPGGGTRVQWIVPLIAE